MKIINKYLAEKQLLEYVKILSFTNVVTLIAIFSLVAVIYSLLPLKEIHPYLVQVKDRSEQVVKIEPIDKNVNGFTVLTEALVRQYVIMRETIDLSSENTRWNQLAFFHSEDLDMFFREFMSLENKDSPLVLFSERRLARKIEILSSINFHPSASNVWQIEWIATDYCAKRGDDINKQIFVSTVTVDFVTNNVILSDRLVNPTGFRVVNYVVTRKKQQVIKDE